MPDEQEDDALKEDAVKDDALTEDALADESLEDGPLTDDALEEAPPEDGAVVEPPSTAAPRARRETLIIGAAMLVVGMVLGFVMRPWVPLPAMGPAPTAQPTSAPTKAPAAAVATRTPAPPTATVNPTVQAQQRKDLAAYVASNTRHFEGNANAPVTLIEFSDYQ